MGRPGRKRRLVLEDEYWKLTMGTVEAGRRLGIGRTTGYYWRSQRGGLARTVRAEDSRWRAGDCHCWSANASPSYARTGAPCGSGTPIGTGRLDDLARTTAQHARGRRRNL